MIDEIKARYPIQDVAARYADLHKSGGYLKGRCPFHDDHHPSFVVHLETATWRCYGACGAGGDVIDLVGYATYRTAWDSRNPAMFREILRVLTGDTDTSKMRDAPWRVSLPPLRRPVPAEWHDPVKWQPVELATPIQLALDVAARVYHMTLITMGRGAGTPYAYLRSRGFDDATIRREGLGYAVGDRLGPALTACGLSRQAGVRANLLEPERGQREFLTGRIVFVDRDRSGRTLHLIGRRWPSRGPGDRYKYLSLKEIEKPLYGYARLDRRPSDRPLIVVESPPDAVTARQWGVDAVAVIGTGLKPEHAVLLSRLRRPKIYVPHNDENGAGLAAARRWQEAVGEGEIRRLPDGAKDLNELGPAPDGKEVFLRLIS